jgi:hypothetical protein
MATRVIQAMCRAGLVLWVAPALGNEALRISPRPGSEAAGLNVSHPDLPGNTFDEPLIALASRDGQWTAGLWFERAAWASANAGDDRACFHLFPLFGRIEPGASATVRGAFHLRRGSPEELRRCGRQLLEHNRRDTEGTQRGPIYFP